MGEKHSQWRWCLQMVAANLLAHSVGLVWGLAAIRRTGWTLVMTMSWWQHHKHCRGYYYYYYYSRSKFLATTIVCSLEKGW